jgi:integration host factor subunit beta
MAPREPETITKKELVNRIADSTRQTKVVVKDILQKFLDEIVTELAAGNRLEFREFGVFEVKDRAARRAQNPRTLQKVEVPAKRVVKFKVGRIMRERIDDIPEPEPRPVRPAVAQPAPAKPLPPAPPAPKPPPSNSPF